MTENALKDYIFEISALVNFAGLAPGNISISLHLLHTGGKAQLFYCSVGQDILTKVKHYCRASGSQLNLVNCVQIQTMAGKLNVKVKAICVNFPLQFRRNRILVNEVWGLLIRLCDQISPKAAVNTIALALPHCFLASNRAFLLCCGHLFCCAGAHLKLFSLDTPSQEYF